MAVVKVSKEDTIYFKMWLGKLLNYQHLSNKLKEVFKDNRKGSFKVDTLDNLRITNFPDTAFGWRVSLKGINGGNSLSIKLPLSIKDDKIVKITITSEDGTSKVMKKHILKPRRFMVLFTKAVLNSFGLLSNGNIIRDLSLIENLYGEFVFDSSIEECTLLKGVSKHANK